MKTTFGAVPFQASPIGTSRVTLHSVVPFSSTSSPTAQHTVLVQSVPSYAFPIPLPLVSASVIYITLIHQHHTSFMPSVFLSPAEHTTSCFHTAHRPASDYMSVPQAFLNYPLYCDLQPRYHCFSSCSRFSQWSRPVCSKNAPSQVMT